MISNKYYFDCCGDLIVAAWKLGVFIRFMICDHGLFITKTKESEGEILGEEDKCSDR